MKKDTTGTGRLDQLVARIRRDMPRVQGRVIEAVSAEAFGRRSASSPEAQSFTQEERLLAILTRPMERCALTQIVPGDEDEDGDTSKAA